MLGAESLKHAPAESEQALLPGTGAVPTGRGRSCSGYLPWPAACLGPSSPCSLTHPASPAPLSLCPSWPF